MTLVVACSDKVSGHLGELQRQEQRAGAEVHVRFMGKVDGELELDVLQGTDAYALLPPLEGLPVALAEALRAGLPCIASTELDLPEMAEATQQAGQSTKLAQQRYTWPAIARQTLDVHVAMLARRGAAGCA